MTARRRIPFLLLGVFALVATVCAPNKVSAQASNANVAPRTQDTRISQIEERRRKLFARMMASPADLDAAFEYAALSSETGDLEAAISTLERLLIFAPDVARLQLELGVLYFRLGSFDVARNHFNSVLDAPNVPVPVRLSVDRYLAAIKAQTVNDRFNGAVLFGTRYQSNANGGAMDRIAQLNGVDFILNDEALADPDANAFVSGSFHYSHDFSMQGDRFDADLLTYGALYGHHHEINVALAELKFGPVFNLARFGLDDVELGTYGILGGIVLRSDPYRLTGGGGIRLSKLLTPQTRVEAQFEYRHQDYRNSDFRPSASDRTGERYDLGGTIMHRLSDRLSVFALFNTQRIDARRGFQSNWQIEAGAGVNYSFDSPWKDQERLWAVGLSAGLARRIFDEPDQSIVGMYAQRDTERFIRGSLTVPAADTWSIQAAVGYQNVNSNYDINTFDNVSTSIGIMKRF